MWQSVFCGCNPPPAPIADSHSSLENEITWSWSSAAGAEGYKYNTANDYSTATDLGNVLSYAQGGLDCESSNTLYVWAYNACGPSASSVFTYSTSSCVLSIGDTYAGGIVFYLDGSGGGLVCAPFDQSSSAEFGCMWTIIGGTLASVGSGQANTNAILNDCSQSGIAAELCDDLVLGGYSDWYLPSKDELNLMYTNLHLSGFGNFSSAWYRTSTEHTGIPEIQAYVQNFGDGMQHDVSKDFLRSVRAVRTF